MKIKIITSIALEKHDKFLILKISLNDTMPDMWEFPGGKVNVNEKLEESAKREVIEETGLVPNEVEYKGYSERFSENRNIKSEYHTIVHHFYCNNFQGAIELSKEHSEFRWVTKEEILRMKIGEEVGSDTIEYFKIIES